MLEDLYRFPSILEIKEIAPTQAPETSLIDAIARIRLHTPDGQLLDARLGRIDGQLNCYARIWDGKYPRIVDMDLARAEVNMEIRTSALTPTPRRQQEELEQRMKGLIEPAIAIATATSAIEGSWARAIEVRRGSEEPVYAVEIVSGSELKEVRVLARSGRLLDTAPLPRTSHN